MDQNLRAFNFKADEVEVLVTEVEKVKDVLFGRFSVSLTREKKEREWAKVAETVSAVSGIQRSVDAIKKKLTTLTSDTKKKAAFISKEQKKTGGGPSSAPPSLTPAESRIVDLISKVNYEGKQD